MFQTIQEQVFELCDQGYGYAEIAEMTNTTVEFVVDMMLAFQEFFTTQE